ncbi:hypothetical protein CYMTET_32742 [Cymbomonas tetramitiformis]|uniref:Beta-galactosidase n=1 Tax=Cymbomonas tetramitiformis TaxID=36881 RepID=A0AAE0FEG7_9CHLO|nr:hypothetical protein CYMTET_32742 [Cymbomonas tetramitiformis]
MLRGVHIQLLAWLFASSVFNVVAFAVASEIDDVQNAYPQNALSLEAVYQNSFGTDGKGNFALDGKPHRILSGSIHYWRIPHAYWEHRLSMLRDVGLNTVETYVPWFLHERFPGNFSFQGDLDVEKFVGVAHSLGLLVILRPGPYICSEVDLGGLPSWLLREDGMRLRSSHQGFLAATNLYLAELLPRMAPLQYDRGGPIIAMQLENEFGKFGPDPKYMRHLHDAFRAHDITCMLMTCDFGTPQELDRGSEKGALPTVNFGPQAWSPAPAKALALLRKFLRLTRKDGQAPLMVMEMWAGWFDYWGEGHARVETEAVVGMMEEALEEGASFNLYMFHGGTNFGFTAGAHMMGPGKDYTSFTTSYDYDAAVMEDGRPSAKFLPMQRLLRSYHSEEHKARWPPLKEAPTPPPRRGYGRIVFTHWSPLLTCPAALPDPIRRGDPLPMERLPLHPGSGQRQGFLLYRTNLTSERIAGKFLELTRMADRAQVFVSYASATANASGEVRLAGKVMHRGGADSNLVSRQMGAAPSRKMRVTVPQGGARLDILVENLGRVTLGPAEQMHELKGLLGPVTLGGSKLPGDWDMYPLEMEEEYVAQVIAEGCWRKLPSLDAGAPSPSMPALSPGGSPVFLYGTLHLSAGTPIADTFLDTTGWRKGVVFINGFNIGRYWERGPQRRLYVPATLLKEGANHILLFEQEGITPSPKPLKSPVECEELGKCDADAMFDGPRWVHLFGKPQFSKTPQMSIPYM